MMVTKPALMVAAMFLCSRRREHESRCLCEKAGSNLLAYRRGGAAADKWIPA